MANEAQEIVILGAGVIGLTIAHVLSDPGQPNRKITIVARDMPEDLDSQGFASPWAGANWSPIGGFDERTHRWEKATFDKFWDMIPTGLVRELATRVFYLTEESASQIWYKDLVRNYRELGSAELSTNFTPEPAAGVAFSTISVNPHAYLPWLKEQLVSRGVKFLRKRIASVDEAASLVGPGGILINATGLGARSLIGVEDLAVHPIRGQTILVHSPDASNECIMVMGDQPSAPGEATYIIPRASATGTVLLGGTYQKGNWDTALDMATARGILARCAALQPALRAAPRVLAHGVGLRPARTGGPRVEAEWVERGWRAEPLAPWVEPEPAPGRVLVIHAYGFGPAGYQNSWGAAEEVAQLLRTSAATRP